MSNKNRFNRYFFTENSEGRSSFEDEVAKEESVEETAVEDSVEEDEEKPVEDIIAEEVKDEPIVEEAPKKNDIVVEVKIDNLNVRKGPGKNYETLGGFLKPGIYHLSEKANGQGSSKGWGKLKDKEGWISLEFCIEID